MRLRSDVILRVFAPAILTLGVIVAIWATRAAANQPTQTIDPTPIAQPEQPPEVGPAGQEGPFNFHIPEKVDNPGAPSLAGGYRLVPYGYSEPLSHTELPFPPGQPIDVNGWEALGDSPLREVPAYLPDGYKLSNAQGLKVDGELISVELVFEGPGFPLSVVIRTVMREPIDINLHPESSLVVITAGDLQGVQAIFQRAKTGTKFQVPISVRFVRGSAEYILEWRVTGSAESDAQFQELIRVAQSYIQ